MAEITDVLLPIFAVVFLGAMLRTTGFAAARFFQETNRLVYWVAIPCYLFYKTAEATIQGDSAVRVFGVLVLGMLAMLATGYLAARLLRLPRSSTSAFVQGTYRSNLAYVGLPVILLAFPGRGGQPQPGIEAIAVLATALMIPIYNTVAVLVLVLGQSTGSRQLGPRIRDLVRRLATNPLLLSCLAGLMVLALGWKLPAPLRKTLALVGDMTTPLALLGIGASLTFGHLRERWRDAGLSAALKLVAAPLVGWIIGTRLGLTPAELRMALIYLACPTATASYVMALQLGSDHALAADIVVLSTALSLPALAAVMAVT